MNAILENNEPTIGLGPVARKIKRNPSTITNWIQKGCTAADGTRVKLEGVRIGYKWMTSEAALNRFFERLSAIGETAREHVIPPTDRRKQVAAAVREMEMAGA